jgi:hypothetical protein
MPIDVPKFLAPYRSHAGSHRRGFKILVTGRAGTGKSFFASHAPGEPGERVILECGEGGIEQYLDAAERDYTFTVANVDVYQKTLKWLYDYDQKNPGQIKSVIIDPANLQWEEQLDYWQDKLGHEIKGGDWRHVKAPWKQGLRWLTRASFNVVMTCHLKDLQFIQEKEASGAEGKLQVLPQEVPQIEKNAPYIFDFVFLADFRRDNLNRPTHIHTLKVFKGRRPKSVKPEDLYAGKEWKFNALKPEDPWQRVIEPIASAWKDGAVDTIGADEREENEELYDVEITGHDAELGRILRLIEEQKDMKSFARMWEKEISQSVMTLSPDHRKQVEIAKERKKKDLTHREVRS